MLVGMVGGWLVGSMVVMMVDGWLVTGSIMVVDLGWLMIEVTIIGKLVVIDGSCWKLVMGKDRGR